MPNTKSAMKRMRSNERKRLRNMNVKSALRMTIKNAEQAFTTGNLEQAQAVLREALKKLDKAAQKGVIKKGTANRKKSRITKKFNRIQAA